LEGWPDVDVEEAAEEPFLEAAAPEGVIDDAAVTASPTACANIGI